MLVDRQKQYSAFIENLWSGLSDSTKDILQPPKQPHNLYNFISLRLTLFFQQELKKLEAENKSPKPSKSNPNP